MTSEQRGKAALIGIVSPPVNAFSLPVRDQLVRAIQHAQRDDDIEFLVLYGTGRGFSAGGDIKEFGTSRAQIGPGLASDLQPLIECSRKPVVAAIHGFALGGGLETAMACHYRVSSRTAIVGLPELAIGLIPPSGTQRLPRLVGLDRATEMILGAQRVTADSLAGSGLFDALVDEDTPSNVVDAALALAAGVALDLRPTRDLPVYGAISFEHSNAATPQQRAALRALEASATLPFDAAMGVAMSAYQACYRARTHRTAPR